MRDLLVKVLRSRPEHELLVDLHVELGALGLQLAPACRCPGVGALQERPNVDYVACGGQEADGHTCDPISGLSLATGLDHGGEGG